MEVQMKKDMIQDMHLYNNRVLLHEERVEGSKYLVVVCFMSLSYFNALEQ